MKATLTFDLSNPEEKEAHLRAVKATDLAIALFDIQESLRLLRKADTDIKIEEIENLFYAKLSDNNILLDEILT